MPFCIYCGSKLKENANFCIMCGKKVTGKISTSDNNIDKKINNDGREQEIGIKFSFLGHEIGYSKALVEYNRYWKYFAEKITELTERYEIFYTEKVKSFEDIYNRGIPYVGELVYEIFEYAVRTLNRYGVSDIYEPDYEEMCSDGVEEIIENNLKPLINFSEKIAKQTRDMQNTKAIQRESRSQWEGGGFGFSGAIKGAIMAGVLNAGTNAVRKVADAYTDAQDNHLVIKQKREYFNNGTSLEQLKDTIYDCGGFVFEQTYKILISKKNMPSISLLDEKERRDVNYYLNRLDKGKNKALEDKLIESIIQNIRKNPYEWELYDMLYRLLPYEKQEINKLVEYFGVGYYYYKAAKEMDVKRLEYIRSLPDITSEDIEKKEMLLKALAKDAKNMNLGTLFTEIREKKEVLLKMQDFKYLLSGDKSVLYFLYPKIKDATKEIADLLEKKDFHSIWDKAESGNVYAQFVLMEYYELHFVRQNGLFARDITPTPEKHFIKTDTAFAKFLKSYLHMLDTKEGFDYFGIEQNIATIYRGLENKTLQISAIAVCCILWCETRKGFKSSEEFLAAAETLAFCNQPMIVASLGKHYRKKGDYEKAAYFFKIALLYDCDYARRNSSDMATEKLRKGFDEWCERIGG